MSQVTLLKQLQSLDDTIIARKSRLGAVMQEMNVPDTLTDARQQDVDTAEALAELQRIQRDLELQHGSLDSKYKASHDRMYSGKVKNSRELADLEKEVASLAKRRSKLEDEMLENMMMVEEAAEARDSAEKSLATLESEWEVTHAALNDEKLSLATTLSKLLTDRKTHAAKVEPKVLRSYMDIFKKRKGSAVVALNGDRCSGCRMSVSLATSKAVGEGQIAYCGSCGRILF